MIYVRFCVRCFSCTSVHNVVRWWGKNMLILEIYIQTAATKTRSTVSMVLKYSCGNSKSLIPCLSDITYWGQIILYIYFYQHIDCWSLFGYRFMLYQFVWNHATGESLGPLYSNKTLKTILVIKYHTESAW